MKIHWRALEGQNETAFLALDLILLFLISINLLCLLVDAILLYSGVGVMLGRHFPDMLQNYRQHWHTELLVYDSIFTFFLIAELLLRWGVAIKRKTYYRWFFYPFVHWYDVLGCIPLPPFRTLRLLRLISIIWRLQKFGVVDFSKTGFFSFLTKYYRIVLEELSDRVVVQVLEGVQQEIHEGGPLTHRLGQEILRPHRNVIVSWLADLVAQTSAHTHSQHREKLAQYLDIHIRIAISQNTELQKLKRRLLFIGSPLEAELQQIVASLVTRLLDDILSDISQPDNAAINDIAASLFDTITTPYVALDDTLRSILLDAIDLIKAQVRIQRWKEQADTSA